MIYVYTHIRVPDKNAGCCGFKSHHAFLKSAGCLECIALPCYVLYMTFCLVILNEKMDKPMQPTRET